MRRLLPAALALAVLGAGGVALSAAASDQPPVPADPAAPSASPSAPTATPASAPKPKTRTAVTLTVKPSRVATGKSVTLSGVAGPLRAGKVVPLKRARITAQYRVRGATHWTTIRTVTAPTGSYRIVWRYPLRTSSTVRAVLAAGTTTASAVSPSRSITRIAPAPKPRTYANCVALNRVYPHGVGLPGAVDHTSGPRVTNFTRDAATYRLNPGRDRDKDGIACERH